MIAAMEYNLQLKIGYASNVNPAILKNNKMCSSPSKIT